LAIFIIITIVVILTLCFTIFYRGKKKTDQGFQFNYYKLSHRRKFIRTLIMLPFIIGALIIIYMYGNFPPIFKTILTIGLFILYLGQIIYNYKQWQKEKAEV